MKPYLLAVSICLGLTIVGCGQIIPTQSDPSSPPSESTTVNISGNCIIGYELPAGEGNNIDTTQYDGFVPGAARGETIEGTYFSPAMAYQLTLRNPSNGSVDITGFAVVFYDSAGSEAGSDQQSTQEFITAGQSLTWTELADTTTVGYGDGGNDPNIPNDAATCQLVKWYHQ
jgi:hypothetical protein